VAEGEAGRVRIVFWGTSDFAVPGLQALLGEAHEVVGVVTQPDRPAGRGLALRTSPVKRVALEEMIPVFQPERPRGAEVIAKLREFEPDIFVVIAYGQILKREVLDLPPLGSINVHASLLPELRGAAPIAWAIIRGHTETGVTIMRMNERLDAGPILLQIPEPIEPDERAADLWTRLSETGAAALVEALALIEAGVQEEQEQDESRVTLAPRIERKDARIDWNQSAADVDRLIRGLDSVPGAWSALGDREVKLFRPRVVTDSNPRAEPGTVIELHEHDDSDGFQVACNSGTAVWIREVTPPGKRRMTAAAWARGRGISVGDRFS
jgi:methionyl-tRNA formyltransferase